MFTFIEKMSSAKSNYSGIKYIFFGDHVHGKTFDR